MKGLPARELQALPFELSPERLVSSNLVRAIVGIAVLALLLLFVQHFVGSLAGTSREQRYTKYLAFFEKQQRVWCREGFPEDVARERRLFSQLLRAHSLLRLFFDTEWTPLPPQPRLRSIAVLLAVVQATGLVAVIFFVPPVRSMLWGFGGQADLLPIIFATSACIAAQLCLRLILDSVGRARASLLFRRPDVMGRTEGHVLARAALAHFDHTNTLQRILWTWRQNALDMEQLKGLLTRLRYHRAVRIWLEACAIIDERNAAARLRAQKLHAWTLVDEDWLYEFADAMGARLAPLGRQLKFAMPLDEALLDSLAVSTHERLEPSASERLLEKPAVARAKLFFGGAWALREWKAAVAAMARALDKRRTERSSLLARRTAAAARRARAVLGRHAGFYMWVEACELIAEQQKARQRVAQSMASFGLSDKSLMEGLGVGRDLSSDEGDDEGDSDDEGAEEEDDVEEAEGARFDSDAAPGTGAAGRAVRNGGRVLAATSPEAKLQFAARHQQNLEGELLDAGRTAWKGVPALHPELLLHDAQRMEEVEQRATDAHPPPPTREQTKRVLRNSLPYPVGAAIASVDRIHCVQTGVPPPIFVPAVRRTQLRKGELSPRLSAVEERRDLLMSKLSRLAQRLEMKAAFKLSQSFAGRIGKASLTADGSVAMGAMPSVMDTWDNESDDGSFSGSFTTSSFDSGENKIAKLRGAIASGIRWLHEERMKALALADLRPAGAGGKRNDVNARQAASTGTHPKAVALLIDQVLHDVNTASQVLIVHKLSASRTRQALQAVIEERKQKRQKELDRIAAREALYGGGGHSSAPCHGGGQVGGCSGSSGDASSTCQPPADATACAFFGDDNATTCRSSKSGLSVRRAFSRRRGDRTGRSSASGDGSSPSRSGRRDSVSCSPAGKLDANTTSREGQWDREERRAGGFCSKEITSRAATALRRRRRSTSSPASNATADASVNVDGGAHITPPAPMAPEGIRAAKDGDDGGGARAERLSSTRRKASEPKEWADAEMYLNASEFAQLQECEKVVQQAGRLGTLLKQRASLIELVDEQTELEQSAKTAAAEARHAAARRKQQMERQALAARLGEEYEPNGGDSQSESYINGRPAGSEFGSEFSDSMSYKRTARSAGRATNRTSEASISTRASSRRFGGRRASMLSARSTSPTFRSAGMSVLSASVLATAGRGSSASPTHSQLQSQSRVEYEAQAMLRGKMSFRGVASGRKSSSPTSSIADALQQRQASFKRNKLKAFAQAGTAVIATNRIAGTARGSGTSRSGVGTGRSSAMEEAIEIAAAEFEAQEASRARDRAMAGLQRVDHALRRLLDRGAPSSVANVGILMHEPAALARISCGEAPRASCFELKAERRMRDEALLQVAHKPVRLAASLDDGNDSEGHDIEEEGGRGAGLMDLLKSKGVLPGQNGKVARPSEKVVHTCRDWTLGGATSAGPLTGLPADAQVAPLTKFDATSAMAAAAAAAAGHDLSNGSKNAMLRSYYLNRYGVQVTSEAHHESKGGGGTGTGGAARGVEATEAGVEDGANALSAARFALVGTRCVERTLGSGCGGSCDTGGVRDSKAGGLALESMSLAGGRRPPPHVIARHTEQRTAALIMNLPEGSRSLEVPLKSSQYYNRNGGRSNFPRASVVKEVAAAAAKATKAAAECAAASGATGGRGSRRQSGSPNSSPRKGSPRQGSPRQGSPRGAAMPRSPSPTAGPRRCPRLRRVVTTLRRINLLKFLRRLWRQRWSLISLVVQGLVDFFFKSEDSGSMSQAQKMKETKSLARRNSVAAVRCASLLQRRRLVPGRPKGDQFRTTWADRVAESVDYRVKALKRLPKATSNSIRSTLGGSRSAHSSCTESDIEAASYIGGRSANGGSFKDPGSFLGRTLGGKDMGSFVRRALDLTSSFKTSGSSDSSFQASGSSLRAAALSFKSFKSWKSSFRKHGSADAVPAKHKDAAAAAATFAEMLAAQRAGCGRGGGRSGRGGGRGSFKGGSFKGESFKGGSFMSRSFMGGSFNRGTFKGGKSVSGKGAKTKWARAKDKIVDMRYFGQGLGDLAPEVAKAVADLNRQAGMADTAALGFFTMNDDEFAKATGSQHGGRSFASQHGGRSCASQHGGHSFASQHGGRSFTSKSPERGKSSKGEVGNPTGASRWERTRGAGGFGAASVDADEDLMRRERQYNRSLGIELRELAAERTELREEAKRNHRSGDGGTFAWLGRSRAPKAAGRSDVLSEKLAAVEQRIQQVVLRVAAQSVRASKMPVDWETESCLRDQGLSSASFLQPRRTSSSNTKWGQVSGAVPLAARRAREAAQYVAEAQERAMQARLHRRQRRNRCKLFLPTLLLLAILLGGGGATITLMLWAQPDGSLPQPWLTSIVLSLALTWFVIEPLMIVRRAGRVADQEGARRVADQNARRVAAQEARDARLTELRNRHLRRVEEGKRAVALAAPGELRTARLPPPVDASGKEMVPNSPSDWEGAKAEAISGHGQERMSPATSVAALSACAYSELTCSSARSSVSGGLRSYDSQTGPQAATGNESRHGARGVWDSAEDYGSDYDHRPYGGGRYSYSDRNSYGTYSSSSARSSYYTRQSNHYESRSALLADGSLELSVRVPEGGARGIRLVVDDGAEVNIPLPEGVGANMIVDFVLTPAQLATWPASDVAALRDHRFDVQAIDAQDVGYGYAEGDYDDDGYGVDGYANDGYDDDGYGVDAYADDGYDVDGYDVDRYDGHGHCDDRFGDYRYSSHGSHGSSFVARQRPRAAASLTPPRSPSHSPSDSIALSYSASCYSPHPSKSDDEEVRRSTSRANKRSNHRESAGGARRHSSSRNHHAYGRRSHGSRHTHERYSHHTRHSKMDPARGQDDGYNDGYGALHA